LPKVQEGYKVEFERGKALYKINCAKCHTKKVKGKEIVPNFTPEQFEAYKIRISNSQHEQNLGEEKMAADELGFIITYLTYKRKTETEKK
jgi:mono/diheme cytochrome c family protein